MSEPVYGRSPIEDILKAQRAWNEYLVYAMEEESRGNPEPMRLVGDIATEHVMQRMEEGARRYG